jgi:hypothetical protein
MAEPAGPRARFENLRSASPLAWAVGAASVGLLIAILAFLLVMGDSALRRTGTNSVVVPSHAEVARGQELCQDNVLVPAGSGSVAPWVGGANGADGGPAAVRIVAGGRVVARGRSPQRYLTGITPFALDRTIEREIRGATLCFVNYSAVPLFVYGDFTNVGFGVRGAPTFRDQPMHPRLDWYGPEPESWWGALPAIADRFPLTKAGLLGPWAFWVALLGAVAIAIAAVLRTIREARS